MCGNSHAVAGACRAVAISLLMTVSLLIRIYIKFGRHLFIHVVPLQQIYFIP